MNRQTTHSPRGLQHPALVTCRTPSGFTLIELLVVMAIIVLLASIMLPVLSYVIRMARRGACEAMINNVTQAVEMYRSELGQPPESRIGREPQAITGYWSDPNNIRYNDLMGAEIMTEALVGYDNAIIQRPAANPPPGANLDTRYPMHANLVVGLGIRNAANLALQPSPGDPTQKNTVPVGDGTMQLTGQVYGPYYPVDKLVSTSLVVDPKTPGVTGAACFGGRPANYPSSPYPDASPKPMRRVIADPFGGGLLYYKAQRPKFNNAQWRQTLCELTGAPAGMDQRDTGVNRSNAAVPLFVNTQNTTATENGQSVTYVAAPIFDLDHNADILNGKNPLTGIAYRSTWAATSTDGLRRWLKGWKSTGTQTENQTDAGYVQLDPDALRVQDYLVISAGPDGIFGRAKNDDPTNADDIANVPQAK